MTDTNKPLTPRDPETGVPYAMATPRRGSELIVTTHNFADKTTWYSTAGRRTDQALTDAGDGLVWTSPDASWTDMVHGKVFDEDDICLDVSHGYAVEVKVDGEVKTPRVPFATSGGDYVVNYAVGTVTFASSQAGKTVVASYSYAINSVFVLAPDAGKKLNIEAAEAQFTSDLVMNDTVVFEIWAYNPYDLPNKVKVAQTSYKTILNFVDEALGTYPAVGALGGAARGFPCTMYGFPFRYGTIRAVLSSQGVELRVRLKDDQAFNGTHATATFYCTVETEEV